MVEAPESPHIAREDGGHVVITPKIRVPNRQQLTPSQAIELVRLTMVAGQAMFKVLNQNGVDIGRMNYQDNGNWNVFAPDGPFLHIHLYGRAIKARIQKYGEACYFPSRSAHPEYYEGLTPLSKEDMDGIREEMEDIFEDNRFLDRRWKLT